MWKLKNAFSNNGSVISEATDQISLLHHTSTGTPISRHEVWRNGSGWGFLLLWWLPGWKKMPPSAWTPTSLKELATSLGLALLSPQLHKTNHQGFSWCHRTIINQQTPAKYMALEFTCKEGCESFKCLLFRSNHFKNNSWWMFKLSPIFAHLSWQKQGCFWNAW